MLLFGHPGITLGSAVLLAKALPRRQFSRRQENEVIESHSSPAQADERPGSLQDYLASGLVSLGNYVDIRLLLIGSLLSDIIDKPLGHLFFRNTLSNGRTFGHTLLFLVLFSLAGVYQYRRYGKTSLLAISFGIFTHLIFDKMWLNTRTLFWPLYGFTFTRGDITDWIPNMLEALLTNPQVYVPELVGAAILTWFLLILVRKHKVFYFLRYGRVE